MTDWPTFWATLGGAVATFLAVAAAIFIAIWGDWLKSLRSRPKLILSITMAPPDCHKITTAAHLPKQHPRAQLYGTDTVTFDSYYLKLAVGNQGNIAATNVIVRALKLERLTDDRRGEYREDSTFIPLNLIWSNSATSTAPLGSVLAARIDPQLPRHCDLMHIDQPASDLIQFNTEVIPNEVAPQVWPTIKPAGMYRLRVAVAADNAKPRYWNLRIMFTGEWFDNEVDMFSRGVTVVIDRDTEAGRSTNRHR